MFVDSVINCYVCGFSFFRLTRYFLDFFRARGFKRVIDDFAKKANIDEKQRIILYKHFTFSV